MLFPRCSFLWAPGATALLRTCGIKSFASSFLIGQFEGDTTDGGSFPPHRVPLPADMLFLPHDGMLRGFRSEARSARLAAAGEAGRSGRDGVKQRDGTY